MTRLTLLALLALSLSAVEPKRGDIAAYRWSLAAVVAANVADAATSHNRPELNPVYGRRFDTHDSAIKAGIVGGGLLVQWLVVRRHPERKRWFTPLNFAHGAIVGGVAVRNGRMR